MIIRLLDKLLRIDNKHEESVESLKAEIATAQKEAVSSINRMNTLLESRNVTFDIHIAVGGQRNGMT
jgi:hypothetical protein